MPAGLRPRRRALTTMPKSQAGCLLPWLATWMAGCSGSVLVWTNGSGGGAGGSGQAIAGGTTASGSGSSSGAAAGANSSSSTMCTPKTCAELGASCGTLLDGCGASLDCGTCSAPETCGGGGTPNACGKPCVPKTCQELQHTCGCCYPDGCGGTLDCGQCPADIWSCGNTQCFFMCTGTCTCWNENCVPLTCADKGYNCGTWWECCSKVDCGTCKPPQTCGGGGKPNVCGP